MEHQEKILPSSMTKEIVEIKKKEGILKITYALYAISIIFPIASIVGVVIAHIKSGEAGNDYLESHYNWLIRTFWWSFLFGVIGAMTFLFGVGVVVFVITGIWYIYRVIRGFLKFYEGSEIK